MELYLFLSLAQFVFTFIIALYFFIMLKGQRNQKAALGNEGKEELEKLKKLRAIKLTEPLTEKTRPVKFEDIIGQEDGIRAFLHFLWRSVFKKTHAAVSSFSHAACAGA